MRSSAGASASPMPLLLFCEYLLRRVQSDNLELLQRIVTEFVCNPQCVTTTTIQSMLQLAFPTISILPVDMEDATERTQSDCILTRMKQCSSVDTQHGSCTFHSLRAMLDSTMELKNWDWLEQVYHEFCRGEEHCLQEFVRIKHQTISILPVRPLVNPQLTPTTSPDTNSSTEPDEEEEDVATISSPDTKPIGLPNGRKFDKALREAVFAVCQALAKTKPWETIFDVTTIEYPFDAVAHPLLAKNLKRFWTHHARVVWERSFWYRYTSPEENEVEQEKRRRRQDSASRLFEQWVIVPAFHALGPQFFVDLDRQKMQHYWWWYRRPVVDLLRMGTHVGRDAVVNYMKNNATKRIADPLARAFEFRAGQHGGHGQSMWSTLGRYQYIRDAIATAARSTQ